MSFDHAQLVIIEFLNSDFVIKLRISPILGVLAIGNDFFKINYRLIHEENEKIMCVSFGSPYTQLLQLQLLLSRKTSTTQRMYACNKWLLSGSALDIQDAPNGHNSLI